MDQGISRFFFVLVLFRGVVQSVLQVDALAAEHNGTDRDALVFLVQVRDQELCFIGSDPARLGIARQKLDLVFSSKEREPSVVFNWSLLYFGGRRVAQLD